MNPFRVFALCAVFLILGGVAGIVVSEQRAEARATKAEQQAVELKGMVDELVKVARAKDEVIEQRTASLASATTDAQRARAAYAALRAGQSTGVQPAPSGTSGAVPSGPNDLVGAADEALAAQDRLIAEQRAQIADLTASRDTWKAACEAEQRRSRSLELALDAQKHANKAGKWIGRLQGFAIGIGIGYGAGRLQR